jgi:type I restriction enzyme M protein
LEYQADEDENITATKMREELTAVIKDMKESIKPPLLADELSIEAEVDLKRYQQALDAIKQVEKRLKGLKATLKYKREELNLKIVLKKFGTEDETFESQRLLTQAEKELNELGSEEEEKEVNCFEEGY